MEASAHRETAWSRIRERRFTVLLALVVLVAFVLPSLGLEAENTALYSMITFSLLALASLPVTYMESKAVFLAGALLVTVTLALRWMALLSPSPALVVWYHLASVAVILMFALIFLRQVFRRGRVTVGRVEAAVTVYLLLGIAWANAYILVNHAIPGSFSSASGTLASVNDWMYLSFVTLTTVGFGDVVPVHRVARSLVVSEALTGQLYLAVLLARLVAMEIEQSGRRAQD